MDKEVLIEYADMKEEIKDLRRRIDADQRELARLNKMIVSDSVACGKKGKKPIRTVKIHGMPVSAIQRKEQILERRMKRLETLETELLEKQTEVEEYIEQIEKSELRMMFRFYFLDGMTYPKVAEQMNQSFPKRHIKYNDENVKKKIQRFFQNVPQCPEEIC